MSKSNAERVVRLQIYADKLRTRLTGGVPERHRNAPEEFKRMIDIDLQKTMATIEKLK